MLLSIMQNVLTLPYFKIFRKDFLWDRVKAQGAVIVLACRYRRLFSLLDRRLGRPLWRERGETPEFEGYHRFIYDLITILVSVLSRPNPLGTLCAFLSYLFAQKEALAFIPVFEKSFKFLESGRKRRSIKLLFNLLLYF